MYWVILPKEIGQTVVSYASETCFKNGPMIRCKLLYRRLSLISFNTRYAQRKSFFSKEAQFFFTFFTFFSCFQYFTGNRDQNTVVQYRLFPRVIARYIRVHPWGWYKHISMRVEFYGCPEGNVYSVLKTAA